MSVVMKYITIRTSDAKLRVPAYIYGAWAVHKSTNLFDDSWSVTMVSIGMCLPGFLGTFDRDAAIRIAAHLGARSPEKTFDLTKETSESYEVKHVIDAIIAEALDPEDIHNGAFQ